MRSLGIINRQKSLTVIEQSICSGTSDAPAVAAAIAAAATSGEASGAEAGFEAGVGAGTILAAADSPSALDRRTSRAASKLP